VEYSSIDNQSFKQHSIDSSKMDTVLSTPELLEMILLKLDMRTLLTTAQRVCLQWQGLIADSPAIQQALFFRPVPMPPSLPSTQNLDGNDNDPMGQRAQKNPLLAELFDPWFNNQPSTTERRRFGKLDPQTLLMGQTDRKRAAFLRAGASWQRMLVQQPPVRSIRHVQVADAMGGTSYRVSSLVLKNAAQGEEGGADDGGLRMGTLYDLTWKLDAMYFSPSWRMYWSKDDDGDASNPNHARQLLNEFLGKATTRQVEEILFVSRYTIQCVVGATTPEQEMWERHFKREDMDDIELEPGFSMVCGRYGEDRLRLEGPAIEGKLIPPPKTEELFRGLDHLARGY
jgi:hypothetical protein